jgi:hypothetical protein
VIVSALVAALLVPVIAGAASSTRFEGKFSNVGGDVSFKLKRSHGKRTVANWRWTEFELTCEEGPTTTSSFFDRQDLRVQKRQFAGRAVIRDSTGRVIGKAKVDGEFGKGWEQASGTFRVTGVLPGSDYTNCDSKLQAWTASEAIRPPR